MKTKIQKWGNSLALRIPKSFGAEMGLDENAEVDLSLWEGRLVVVPLQHYSLDDLLAGITEANLHGEVKTGGAVGNEVW